MYLLLHFSIPLQRSFYLTDQLRVDVSSPFNMVCDKIVEDLLDETLNVKELVFELECFLELRYQ
jgi:hypothetical protein